MSIRLKDNWIVAELKAERERQGISCNTLSKRLGLSSTNISKWERGEVSPSIDHTILWAVALGYHLELTKPKGP